MKLDGKTIAILIAPRGTEEPEFAKPKAAVEQAGGKVVVISMETGEAHSVNNDLDPGSTFSVDQAIGDVSASDFDGLVIPGGSVGADKLRGSDEVVALVRDFVMATKPVAAICHAPWTLIEANVVDGRTLTSFPTLQTDIRNAGGEWVDKEVVIDGTIITSRDPDDLPAFCDAFIDVVAKGGAAGVSGGRAEGKVVIVTGAASGMGEAAARRFAAEGAKLVLGDLDTDGLEKLAGGLGGEVEVKRTDVSDFADCEALVAAAVERFGRVDVVFANAGVDHLGKVDEGPYSDFNKVIETDLYGVVHMNRAAIAELRKSKGCIVNMSSVSGIGGDWNHSFYCAAKGGVSNFTRALAMDEATHGVRVNAVNPSLVYTALTSGMQDQPDLIAKFEERIPMGRGAQPEDIAGVILFLASDDARFVTGVNLPIDGGLSAANGQPPLH